MTDEPQAQAASAPPSLEDFKKLPDMSAAGSPPLSAFQEAKKHVDDGQNVPHPVVKKILDWLPAAFGTAGEVMGGPGGAMLGGATGESWKILGNVLAGNPNPATEQPTAGRASLQAANDIAREGVIQGATAFGGPAVSRAVSGGLERLGIGTMQSAVKPGIRGVAQAVVKGQQSPIVMTLLKEGVNVSPAGIERLTGIIDASNQAVKDALDAIPSSGSIDANAVADRLDALVAKYSKGANPEANVSAVKAVKDEFLRNHGTPQSLMQAQQGLSPAEAQAIKQQTYQDLKETAYGSVKTASIEGQKEIARGLKEGIESEAQRTGQANVQALNAREGAAISARDEVAKRIASAGNRDPVALAWLAHNPTAGMMFLMERSPAVKSMLARGLYQSAALAANVPTSVMSTILRGLAVSAQGDEK